MQGQGVVERQVGRAIEMVSHQGQTNWRGAQGALPQPFAHLVVVSLPEPAQRMQQPVFIHGEHRNLTDLMPIFAQTGLRSASNYGLSSVNAIDYFISVKPALKLI